MREAGKLNALFCALLFSCSQVIACPSIVDIDVELKLKAEKALVIVRNGPLISVNVPVPLVEWQPGTGGIEWRVWELSGAEMIRCVMIDYSPGFQKWAELAAGEGVSWEYSLGDLAERYCLTGGEYLLQAIFHNEIGSDKISREVISNPVLVKITR